MNEEMHDDKQDWDYASPRQLPKPTYFPFFLALSVAFFLWGLVSLWIIALAGLIGMGISLAGWINNMLYERDSDS